MIDIKDRHPETKAKKWLQIQKEMAEYLEHCEPKVNKSLVKVDMLKNSWDKIRENYVRYKSESKGVSGSEAKEIDPPEHVEIMRSYDGMLAKRK